MKYRPLIALQISITYMLVNHLRHKPLATKTIMKMNVLIFAVDLVDYRLVTELEGSQASLGMAKATPQVAGKPPTEFPFFTGMSLTE